MNIPSRMAHAARRWLSSANASCSSRVMPYSFATFSAVMPSEIVQSLFILELTNRQPTVESAMGGTSRFQPVPDFSTT